MMPRRSRTLLVAVVLLTSLGFRGHTGRKIQQRASLFRSALRKDAIGCYAFDDSARKLYGVPPLARLDTTSFPRPWAKVSGVARWLEEYNAQGKTFEEKDSHLITHPFWLADSLSDSLIISFANELYGATVTIDVPRSPNARPLSGHAEFYSDAGPRTPSVAGHIQAVGRSCAGLEPHLTDAMKAQGRFVRLTREDSALTETISPVAGTYRVTVLFPSGDSSVLFSRTEPHPVSSIRELRQTDEDYKPILGYYLRACSAISINSLPARALRPQCQQSYYAVSVLPITRTRDSATWHGDVDPIVDVNLLDPRAAVRNEAHHLFGAGDRPREWRFMPGVWTTYQSGRVQFDWPVSGRRGGYRVRADRIASDTLLPRQSND